ncbi:MAG: class I tRNA ligase family protein [Oscillospiraceae bacterium]|nr:class I tRNA ligase family protein [Oscillospiraceae bacterium]
MSHHPERPSFPRRTVVTGGMPYGNKELHFGHIGGVFVHADIFARFLRDRIGAENVIFMSGTDCYGSTIEVSYEQAAASGFRGSLTDFVRRNHEIQKETLDRYQISLDIYAASALDEAGEIHAALSADLFRRLHGRGVLKLTQTLQFYDEDRQTFLNGRQVTGRCPIQGCKSETAYADECALGHQYSPDELIAPVSALSGKPPSRVAVSNWFFDLPSFAARLEDMMRDWENDPACRKSLIAIAREFLRKPSVYVKRELVEEIKGLPGMPPFTVAEEENKPSWALSFAGLDDRARAVAVLAENGIRYRTGKTLVPFRLSGNIPWGIPVPEAEDVSGLTFWVWPESLWAPVSFTKAYLGGGEDWERWWKSDEARVYQFIGEDNIVFYGVAEMGLFMALDEGFRLPLIVPNHHLLYGKTKASSSGKTKPPTAAELLDRYTPEQLRLHFMNASLGERSSGFEPKALMPGSDGGFDTVLYEGNLVSNIFNRLVRSCFYTAQKYTGGALPGAEAAPAVIRRAEETILAYERMMSRFEFDKIFELLNLYLRDANKDWAARSKSADEAELVRLLADSLHVVRVAAALFHPIVPAGCERIREYLQADRRIWDWRYIFEPLAFFTGPDHQFRFLEPRVDFFSKHPSQLSE